MPLQKQDIKELRGDLSPFLIHLTRGGTYTQWADIYGLSNNNAITMNAKQSLEGIIQSNKIQARSPFGYFNYKVPYRGRNQHSSVQRTWLRSVCFTETPVDHIYVQCESISGRQLIFEPYGLAFFEPVVRRASGNPVMYFESSNQQIRTGLDAIALLPNCQQFSPMMILYEAFGQPLYYNAYVNDIDFRWEREWRVQGDFNFNSANGDVAFGICPENEILYFEGLVNHAFPFIDPRRPIGLLRHKLRGYPALNGLI